MDSPRIKGCEQGTYEHCYGILADRRIVISCGQQGTYKECG